jgi:hypothetical protein
LPDGSSSSARADFARPLTEQPRIGVHMLPVLASRLADAT